MKTRLLLICLMIALLAAVIPAFADEELIWSNFNNEPVKNNPKHYGVFPVPEDHAPVLVTRIRTFHWNNGNGAEPGTICIREGNTTKELQCWQAVGRSAYGVPNVYWEVLTDFVMLPGESYGIKVSDFDSWSNNSASNEYGMIELYGEDPAPDVYNTSVPGSSGSAVPSALSIGQTFKMGRYEQDNNLSNGFEPIEWLVLTVQGDRALVVSKYLLDEYNYVEMTSRNTWEYSLMRNWLNGDFYNNAFDSTEKARILQVTNPAVGNSETGIQEDNPTYDRVFLLSLEEAENYFKSDSDRKTGPTPYLKDKIRQAYDPYTPPAELNWMLRSPALADSIRAVVGGDGKISSYVVCGIQCDKAFFTLRPAFWIKTAAQTTPTPQPRTCYKVTYAGNNCLAKVPTDSKCYQLGDLVTILFEPVEYMQGQIFNGWDMDGDGTADFGYYYPTFAMPGYDVELKAVCYRQYQDYGYNQYGVTTGEVDPQYYSDPQQYYNPYHDPTLNNDIYDPNTGWWFDPNDYSNYYGGVG